MTNAVEPRRYIQSWIWLLGVQTLLSAVELGLFTELAKGPADLVTLSRGARAARSLKRDFLDALVALRCSTARTGAR